ncbi:rubrerythrin family protein [Clostridium sp. D2Q-11]|uniref:Rubrerythrin family protein n=1 Tax=Anaeromonas frigoriresistens TaxID=2683708 RepID=A0A942UZ39_9FIRM|nr:rubrerythrin family protein [Anaeromonas frigoriresistens]MBS4538242.1 rubrerythrin family protein [Anaeromonas frigoriresistens]
MASLKGTKTEQNLLKAFAGESQARNRYTMFAKQAKKEGYEQIADFFLQTAENEYQHAKIFFSFLEGGDVEITATYPAGKVGTTAENLKAAADGENEEFVSIYPEFAKIAEEEGFKKVAFAFKTIAEIEKDHEERYLQLLDNVKNELVFKKENEQSWYCRKCGHVHTGEKAPGVCPVCKHPEAYFEIKQSNY